MAISGSANCLPPGTRVAEFRLHDVLGEGGFGIVYRATDLSLDRTVAVKEFLPATLAGRAGSRQIHVRPQHKGTFDAGLRSFINEARWLAKFSHPALVHVYRFFEDNGTAYMVMRHYEGQTLGALLEQQPGMASEAWLTALLSPIMDVLEALHAADFFHRDIAPDNIFLQADGQPVLLDFGAARRIIGDMTQALTMVLKPGYAPVEQYVDDGTMPQGPWTDIYQLGAVMFLAMTGQPPATSVARMIKDPVPAQIDAVASRYGPRIIQGLRQALAVNPQDRPQSIPALRALLGVRSYQAPAAPAWTPSAPAPLDAMPHADVVTPAVAAAAVSTPTPAAPVAEPVVTPDPPPPPAERPAVAPVAPGRRVRAATAAALLAAAGLGGWWMLQPADPARVVAEAPVQAARAAAPTPVAAPPDGRASAAAMPAVATAPTPQAEPATTAVAMPVPAPASTPAAPPAVAPAVPPAPPTPAATAATAATEPASAALPAAAEPAPPAAKPAPARPVRTPPTATDSGADATAATATAKATGRTGKLLLRVLPWGSVWINQKSMGTTPPLTQVDLPAGRHRVEVSNPSGPPVTTVVVVKAGESVIFSHDFEQGANPRP